MTKPASLRPERCSNPGVLGSLLSCKGAAVPPQPTEPQRPPRPRPPQLIGTSCALQMLLLCPQMCVLPAGGALRGRRGPGLQEASVSPSGTTKNPQTFWGKLSVLTGKLRHRLCLKHWSGSTSPGSHDFLELHDSQTRIGGTREVEAGGSGVQGRPQLQSRRPAWATWDPRGHRGISRLGN